MLSMSLSNIIVHESYVIGKHYITRLPNIFNLKYYAQKSMDTKSKLILRSKLTLDHYASLLFLFQFKILPTLKNLEILYLENKKNVYNK